MLNTFTIKVQKAAQILLIDLRGKQGVSFKSPWLNDAARDTSFTPPPPRAWKNLVGNF